MSEDARRKKEGAETPSDSSAVATDARDFGEFGPTGQGLDHLMHEINILRLESSFFCFDKKQARTRTEPIIISRRNTKAIVVENAPNL